VRSGICSRVDHRGLVDEEDDLLADELRPIGADARGERLGCEGGLGCLE
jgi:hypothetical protein